MTDSPKWRRKLNELGLVPIFANMIQKIAGTPNDATDIFEPLIDLLCEVLSCKENVLVFRNMVNQNLFEMVRYPALQNGICKLLTVKQI